MDRLSNKIIDKNKFITNILKFCKIVRQIESDDNCIAKNKTSSAKGCYQFINDALNTAYNRLDRYFKLVRKPIIECTLEEQTALFLADMFQRKGTDKYLLLIGNEFDLNAGSLLYSKFHHTNVDEPTKNRMEKFGLNYEAVL
jgi:hypothetical protein